MSVIWTRPAARDLGAIQDYVARDNPVAAYRLTQTVRQCVRHLTDHPNMGRQGRVGGTRELVISRTPYIVPYRVRGDQVEILAVFHGARKWPESFK